MSSIRLKSRTLARGLLRLDRVRSPGIERELAAVELTKAQQDRRALILDGGEIDPKVLAQANNRLRGAQDNSQALDDALAELRQHVTEKASVAANFTGIPR